jgi:hypothetical protein
MRKLLRALALLPVISLTACGGDGESAGTVMSATLGDEFVLGYGETVRVETLHLEFTAVVEDFRCPIGTSVMCVLAGNARILVTATNGQASQVLTLNTDTNLGNVAIFSGHVIELRDLDPWPTSPTPPTDFRNYTATLYVDGWVAPAGG